MTLDTRSAELVRPIEHHCATYVQCKNKTAFLALPSRFPQNQSHHLRLYFGHVTEVRGHLLVIRPDNTADITLAADVGSSMG